MRKSARRRCYGARVSEGRTGRGIAARAAAAAAVLLAPWAYRALSIATSPPGPPGSNLRGFVADGAIALLTLALLIPVARLSRWLAAFCLTVLALGYYANFETVHALGMIASPLDLQYFDDATFVRGSALAVAYPAALFAGLVATFVLAGVGLRGFRLGDAVWPLVLGGLLLGAVLQWPVDLAVSAWRQDNAVAYNVEWLAGRGDAEGEISVSAMRDLVPAIGADLDGAPILPLDGRGHNVLLVVLESVSGNYIETAADYHGRTALNEMPRLDRIFSNNLGFATFFAHSRRTNRGLYALLCGEYPRLLAGTPKMAVAAGRPWRRCLPEVLAEHGYHSVYLQTAPLGFMQKDSFMPAIGFDETYGDPWFERAYHRTEWGVDDKAFFEQALGKIDELEAGDAPWFLTLLNAGTHHPFVVPPDYKSPYKPIIRQAFTYLDEALVPFLKALEARGLREDTLVLITSDESRGAFGEEVDSTATQLSQNWGFLVAMVPERVRRVIGEPFAQSDVPLSILDYLQIPYEPSIDFFGRSVFRAYDDGRVMFFGNLNRRMVGGLKPDGSIVMCLLEGRRCAHYQMPDGKLFGPFPKRVADDERFAGTVREMGRRSLPPSDGAALQVPLIADRVVHIPQTDWLWLQSVSQLAVNPDEWVEVEVEVELLGPDPATFLHTVKVGSKRYVLTARARMVPGQVVKLRYTFASDIPLTRSSIRSRARIHEPGGSAELLFRKRRFEIKRTGERPQQGIQIAESSMEPPPERPIFFNIQVNPIEHFADYLRYRAKTGLQHDEFESDLDSDLELDEG